MKILTHIFTGIFCFTFYHVVSAQPDLEWQKCFGGNKMERPYTIKQTSDGGYIIAGNGQTGAPDHHGSIFYSDYWIVKTNSNGILEWMKSLGGTNMEEEKVYINTISDGYIVSGSTTSNDDDVYENYGGLDYWIVRLDLSGNIVWQKTLGGSLEDRAANIIQTTDEGFIVVGSTHSDDGLVSTHYGGTTSNDIWVVKLDADGNVLWDKNYGGTGYDTGTDIFQTDDGGFVISGSTYSFDLDISGNHGNRDYVVFKTDSMGNIEWQKCYGGSSADEAYKILQVNGGYIVAGDVLSNDGDVTGKHSFMDYWIVRTDTNGNIVWQKCYGGNNADYCRSINICGGTGYIVSGTSHSVDGDITGHHGLYTFPDNWIVRIDTAGNILWQKSMGGTDYDYGGDILQSDDGGIVACSQTSSNDGDVSGNHGQSDYWVYKLQPDSCTIDNTISYSGDLNYCMPGSVTLYAVSDASYSYQWELNGVNLTGEINSSYTSTNITGNYRVKIFNGFCTVLSDTISIVANMVPKSKIKNLDSINDLCFDSGISLQAKTGYGFTYQWIKNDVNIPGATSSGYLAESAGVYKVFTTNDLGCSKKSKGYTIIQTCREANEKPESFSLYPNPASDKLYFEYVSPKPEEKIHIVIGNILGEIIYSISPVISENGVYNMLIHLDEKFTAGIYTLQILTDNQALSKQFVVFK